jgi:hypothetical protein
MTTTPGTCRYCGCRGESCTLPNGEKCVLADGADVCNAAGCMRAELARQRASRGRQPSKYAGWGYGAIAMDMRRKRKSGRGKAGRGKGRAA